MKKITFTLIFVCCFLNGDSQTVAWAMKFSGKNVYMRCFGVDGEQNIYAAISYEDSLRLDDKTLILKDTFSSKYRKNQTLIAKFNDKLLLQDIMFFKSHNQFDAEFKIQDIKFDKDDNFFLLGSYVKRLMLNPNDTTVSLTSPQFLPKQYFISKMSWNKGLIAVKNIPKPSTYNYFQKNLNNDKLLVWSNKSISFFDDDLNESWRSNVIGSNLINRNGTYWCISNLNAESFLSTVDIQTGKITNVKKLFTRFQASIADQNAALINFELKNGTNGGFLVAGEFVGGYAYTIKNKVDSIQQYELSGKDPNLKGVPLAFIFQVTKEGDMEWLKLLKTSNVTLSPSFNNDNINICNVYFESPARGELPIFPNGYYGKVEKYSSKGDLVTSKEGAYNINYLLNSTEDLIYQLNFAKQIYDEKGDMVFAKGFTNVNNNTVYYYLTKYLNNKTADKEPILNESFFIYPNPAMQQINIVLSESQKEETKEMCIFDINGKKLIDKKKFNENLDISNFPNGLYFIHITLSNQKILTNKFVVLK